jgi:hypothetical protein
MKAINGGDTAPKTWQTFFRFEKIFFGQCYYYSFFNTQAMHVKSIIHNSIAMISLKNRYNGGIRTRAF